MTLSSNCNNDCNKEMTSKKVTARTDVVKLEYTNKVEATSGTATSESKCEKTNEEKNR